MKTLFRIGMSLGVAILMASVFSGCGGGGGGQTQVGPVITFTATQYVIMNGNSVTLNWSVTGANQVTSPDFTVNDVNGQITVSPTATKTYTLTDGQSTATVTVVVVEAGKVAFISSRSGQDQLYLMNSDGTNAHVLTIAGTDIRDPAVSPDGTKVAYISMHNGNADVYIANTDGTGAPQQISTNAASDTQPVWSRDGSTLAWTRGADEYNPFDVIVIKPVTGGEEQELIGDARNPSWDPNADQLAFTSRRDGPESIYRIDIAGGDPTKVLALANESLTIDKLSWSKTGKIAFGSYDTTGNIFVVDAAGGASTAIISNSADDGGPSWSPSGTQLVFYTNRDGNYEVYVSDANGNNQARLTNNAADDGVPSWSRAARRGMRR